MALIALIQRANLAQPRRADRARAARRVRRVAVLRRRHDHARDLGAVGGRGPGGGRAEPQGASSSRSRWSCCGAVRRPALRHRRRRPALRADHGRLVRRARPSAGSARRPAPGDPRARSRPTYGAEFLFNHGHEAFVALGGVVLAVTGAEALYADMGHFGAPAIRAAWFALVFPALILNYLGQGALILSDPRRDREPVLPAVPGLGADADGDPLDGRGDHRLPGGDLRRVQRHPAGDPARLPAAAGDPPHLQQEVGQVYVPAVNWIIFAAVVALVVGFGSSERLASAYGIAVTGTLAIDTLLFFFVVRALWRKPLWLRDRRRDRVPDRRPDVLRRQPDQGAARRLVPAGDRARRSSACSRPGSKGREIVTERRIEEEGPLRDVRRRGARRSTRRSPACPAPPCSSTPTRRRRRWRCAPTSSTTTCCTSAC